MMAKMMQCGNGESVLWCLLAISQSFHFCTLEEYYIGGLFMGIGNGVTDGSALIIAIFLGTGFVGNDVWLTEVDVPLYSSPVKISHVFVYVILAS